MARSFAEAFQLAQAIKGATATMAVSPPKNHTAQAAQQSVPNGPWAQKPSGVSPIADPGAADRISQTKSGEAPPVHAAHAEQIILAADSRKIASSAKPAHPAKNGRSANLEEYYRRLKGVKAQRSASSTPLHPNLPPTRSGFATQPVVERSRVTVSIGPEARVVWDSSSSAGPPLLKSDIHLGTRTQISAAPESVRDVVLGFDFGTSSAKVVIGDRGLKKAHAVPFRSAIGIEAYLLPARLYEDNGSYSLHGGTRHFNDLKLALLANADDPSLQCRVVAYLALAIREARGWLFSEHADDYIKTEIVWTVALGLPAEHVVENRLSNVFARLGAAAWAVAEQSMISTDVCRKALEHTANGSSNTKVEVTVTPEIAAQIYGFVSSNRFDAKARNFFLIADVGAGTVDTCLFRVVPAKGARWSFEIYTAAVEPSGVMNLHRHRVGWWQQLLAPDPVGAKLSRDLDSIKLGTENQATIPATYEGYLSGVKVQFAGDAADPDKEFFRIPLVRQLQSRTLYRAFRDNLLGKQDIVDIPFLLCGGGARLSFYRGISDAIRSFEGCSWLSTKSQQLVIPDDLRAEGVGRSDYDRLSVAYGLSMLSLADISTAQQIPKLPPKSSEEQWRDHYVDKDQC